MGPSCLTAGQPGPLGVALFARVYEPKEGPLYNLVGRYKSAWRAVRAGWFGLGLSLARSLPPDRARAFGFAMPGHLPPAALPPHFTHVGAPSPARCNCAAVSRLSASPPPP